MNNNLAPIKNNFQFLLYKTTDEEISINALIKDETIWQTTDIFAECGLLDFDKQIRKILSNAKL